MAKKATGEVSNGYALATEIGVNYSDVNVTELNMNTYAGRANVAAGAVNVARGKGIVRITMSAPGHPTWLIQKFINDIIGGTAGFLNTTTLDTSTWDLDRYEPILGHQRYTYGKCESVSIAYNAAGGPIGVSMSWLAIYGAEQGSPATFGTPTRITGRDYDTGDVTAPASWDLMRSFTWTAGRAQVPQAIADGTYFLIAITSHAIGGTLSVEESPTASQGVQIAAGATLTGTGVFQIGPVTSGIKFTNYVNRDSRRRASPGNGPGTEFWDYSLANINDVGGTGYPFLVGVGT